MLSSTTPTREGRIVYIFRLRTVSFACTILGMPFRTNNLSLTEVYTGPFQFLDFLIFPVSRGHEMQTSRLFNVRLYPEQISHSFNAKKSRSNGMPSPGLSSSSRPPCHAGSTGAKLADSKDGNEVDCEEIRRSPRSQFYSVDVVRARGCAGLQKANVV